MQVFAQLPLGAVLPVLIRRQLLTLRFATGTVPVQFSPVPLEFRHVFLQLGLVSRSDVGLDSIPVGLDLLMGVFLFRIVVMQRRLIPFHVLVSIVQSVKVVFDRTGRLAMPVLRIVVAAGSMIAAPLCRRRRGMSRPRVPNQSRRQQCDGKMLSHSLFLEIWPTSGNRPSEGWKPER